ncbi:MAG TPA: DUF4386 domain-containing protein [Thermomicrobiales bacterium]|jgi:hypothetical protein
MTALTARPERRLVAALLILVPVAFTVCFSLLQSWFEYPAILRQPVADILTKFAAGGPALIAVWYALTLTALLFIPIAVLLHRVLAGDDAPAILRVATTFGIVAGLVQALGFLRWPFLVPQLAQSYLAPEASEAQRAATVVVFDAFHRYVGMGIGEHLGYLSTSIWTVGVALAMWRAPQFGRTLGLSGVVLAGGIAAGLLEPAGWALGGTINTVSYLAWSVWLIAVGVRLLVYRETTARQAPRARTVPAPVA